MAKSSSSSSSAVRKPKKKVKASSSSSGKKVEVKKDSSKSSSSSTYKKPEFYPENVEKIILATRNLQRKQADVEKEFFIEMCKVRKSFFPKFKEICVQRAKLVNGIKEPKSEDEVLDGDWKKNQIFKDKRIRARQPTKFKGDYKGIPEFWLSILLSAMPTSNMVEKHDMPVLRKLKDIRVQLLDGETESKGFTIFFDFGENDFFEETTLSKTYHLQEAFALKSKKASPALVYEEPVIKNTAVVAPSWKKEDNPQQKMVTKTYLNKANGHKKQLTKPEKRQSFFQFFTSVVPAKNKKGDEENTKERKKRKNAEDQQREILLIDYDLATFFKDRLIPRAVLYYTGEAQDYGDDRGYGDEGGYSKDDYDDYDYRGGRGGGGKDKYKYDDDKYSDDYDYDRRGKNKKHKKHKKAKKSTHKKKSRKAPKSKKKSVSSISTSSEKQKKGKKDSSSSD